MFAFQPGKFDQNLKISLQSPVATAVVTAATYPTGNIPINGSLVTLYKATLPIPTTLDFISGGNDSGVLWFILGTLGGVSISEFLQGANAGTATTVNQYDSVLEAIPTMAGVATTVTVGITGGDATAVCASQAGTVDTPLLLNGGDASGVYLNQTYASYIEQTCAGDETGNTFTITGKDAAGRVYSIAQLGVDTTTQLWKVPFVSIYSITCSEDCTDDVSFGTSSQTATPWCTIDDSRPTSDIGIRTFLDVGATLTYHVEYTWEDTNATSNFNGIVACSLPFGQANSVNIPSGSSTSKTDQAPNCLKAVRAVIESYTSGNFYYFQNQSDKQRTT